MTTITIEISDEQARQLAEDAQRESVAVQELVSRRLFTPWTQDAANAGEAKFAAALEYVFDKNAELYRRLA